jgi:serine/threonine protein phosphatase PrpC
MGCGPSKEGHRLIDPETAKSSTQYQKNSNGTQNVRTTKKASDAAATKSIINPGEFLDVSDDDVGGAAAESAAGSKPSTATPYNRAKDRVDAIKESKTITCNGVTMTFAYLSQRGFYPDEPFKANQDSYCIHAPSLTSGAKQDAFFAVFDGHGKDGDGCAIFAKDRLPAEIKKAMEQSATGQKGGGGTVDSVLTKGQIQDNLKRAHVSTNLHLHRDAAVDDSLSGTTAISIYFHGNRNRITVSNLGDSRAVLGQALGEESARPSLKALPLSRDQTPYRKDEKNRVRATGARVLSLDQLEGLEPIDASENNDDAADFVLGEELDEGGDPPRIWHPVDDYPGTAFTRSLGDALAEELGVFAEPEMLTRELQPNDKIMVLASDGGGFFCSFVLFFLVRFLFWHWQESRLMEANLEMGEHDASIPIVALSSSWCRKEPVFSIDFPLY